MPTIVRILIVFGPLLIFFASYLYDGLMLATKTLMLFSPISLIVTYYYEKKIPPIPLFTNIILLVFGAITLMTGNVTFIKIKPTILYLLFAVILFGGLAMNKGILKHVFGHGVFLTHNAWLLFSKRWGYFFIFLALLNEIVWRNFSESVWIKFKVFGTIPIIILFMICQLPFLSKHKTVKKEEKK